MNRFKEIIKKAKGVLLTKAEKARGRERLLAMMRGTEALAGSVIQRGWLSHFTKPVMAGFLIAALLGGGVSFASENSLPGDFLYPVKIKVNEEVRAVLSVNAETKADWEARRAERRFEEAVQLAAEGRLDDEAEASIEAAVEKHALKADENLIKVEIRQKSELDLEKEDFGDMKMEMTFMAEEAPTASENKTTDLKSEEISKVRTKSEAMRVGAGNAQDDKSESQKAHGKRKQVQEKIAKTRKALSDLAISARIKKAERALEVKENNRKDNDD